MVELHLRANHANFAVRLLAIRLRTCVAMAAKERERASEGLEEVFGTESALFEERIQLLNHDLTDGRVGKSAFFDGGCGRRALGGGRGEGF